MGEACSTNGGEKERVYMLLLGKARGKETARETKTVGG
jgi:hypothetical protein